MVGQQPGNLQWQTNFVSNFQSDNTIRCLQKGMGSLLPESVNRGRWTLQESNLHINVLELLAIKLALLTFSRMFKLRSVHFQVDNTTDSFISNEDGRHTKQGDDSQNLKVSGFGWFQAELGV